MLNYKLLVINEIVVGIMLFEICSIILVLIIFLSDIEPVSGKRSVEIT